MVRKLRRLVEADVYLFEELHFSTHPVSLRLRSENFNVLFRLDVLNEMNTNNPGSSLGEAGMSETRNR